ncbi:hypothetical protein NQ318_018207 [Aromia moschata]|uniref:Uncharacterized protein n=1 Tax=Aromia moschata TaxID=1265417 RepID=A0AAV8ZG90_9CUCU|nr:hypothetical protein NQ318_018207 [Aromia moschata]
MTEPSKHTYVIETSLLIRDMAVSISGGLLALMTCPTFGSRPVSSVFKAIDSIVAFTGYPAKEKCFYILLHLYRGR